MPGLHVLNHEKKLNLQQMNEVTRHFWFSVDIKTLSPGGCLPLLMKIYCIKSVFKEIFWNLQQMTEVTRCSCWHQNFVPKGLSVPALGLYTCIKSWKKYIYIYIKSDYKEFFFKLVANDRSDKRFLLTSKFCLLRLSAPDLRLYTFIKSWKDVYKVRGWSDSF